MGRFWRLVLKLQIQVWGQGLQQRQGLGLGPGPGAEGRIVPGFQSNVPVFQFHMVVLPDDVGQGGPGFLLDLRITGFQEPGQLRDCPFGQAAQVPYVHRLQLAGQLGVHVIPGDLGVHVHPAGAAAHHQSGQHGHLHIGESGNQNPDRHTQ